MSTAFDLLIKDGVAHICLNRYTSHNLLNQELTSQLFSALSEIENDMQVRSIVLTALGASFCAGADLNWFRDSATSANKFNSAAKQLAELMSALNNCNKPVLCLVTGNVYGGGIGLVACSDIVLAAPDVRFKFPEVRLGLIPAVISPYVVAAIGSRVARRYLLTAETFNAQQALKMGLIHDIIDNNEITAHAEKICQQLALAGPEAITRSKHLLKRLHGAETGQYIKQLCIESFSQCLDSKEAREGISAFLEKRPPDWVCDFREYA